MYQYLFQWIYFSGPITRYLIFYGSNQPINKASILIPNQLNWIEQDIRSFTFRFTLNPQTSSPWCQCFVVTISHMLSKTDCFLEMERKIGTAINLLNLNWQDVHDHCMIKIYRSWVYSISLIVIFLKLAIRNNGLNKWRNLSWCL